MQAQRGLHSQSILKSYPTPFRHPYLKSRLGHPVDGRAGPRAASLSRPELVFQFGAPEPRSCSVGPASLQTRPEGLGSAPSAAASLGQARRWPGQEACEAPMEVRAGTSFQSMLPLRKLFVSVKQTPSCMARSCQLVWMEAGLAFIMTCHRLLAAYPATLSMPWS